MTKILVVEDDANIRAMLTQRLVWQGYEVIVAGDGAHGISLTMSQRPDLVLMDMGLPILNGWQATHRLKSSRTTRSIPIIALTAFALNEDRQKCLRVGCDDYETKPVDFARLFEKIERLLKLDVPV